MTLKLPAVVDLNDKYILQCVFIKGLTMRAERPCAKYI
jgi:hypothetical protein